MAYKKKSKGHTTGGVDHYKHKATETSVDFKAGMSHEKPGHPGPDRVKASTAKKGDHAPVPGYSHTSINTSLDYKAGEQHQKPGTCGVDTGPGGKRKHY